MDKIRPRFVYANSAGEIEEDPHLLMLCAAGQNWRLPEAGEIIPLPQESELFLLPGRKAVGFNQKTGNAEIVDGTAVAAFIAPGYTLSAHPAYVAEADAPMLPLFAYAAVGYARGRFWVCAVKVDNDRRQQFAGINPVRIEKNCDNLLAKFPQNRLLNHIVTNCCRKYTCPAARNFVLGRYETPLPTSRTCNAACLGCISSQTEDSPIATTPQCRLDFTPDVTEITEVMFIHMGREKSCPIYSFGQGCEGDPLQNPDLLAASIEKFRKAGGTGTINCNTNASRPAEVEKICSAGLTSLRVSLNSSQPTLYEAYYRPRNYTFADVAASIALARKRDVFVSLNLLYFPGITDTVPELAALSDLCHLGVEMIQWRNLNIDPAWYYAKMNTHGQGLDSMGLQRFMKSLRKACPWLRYGYFNPFLGEKAVLKSPKPV